MAPIICAICDKPESECKCDRYCCICTGQDNIRLCMDGLYYCPPCAEACDTNVANPNEATRPSIEACGRKP